MKCICQKGEIEILSAWPDIALIPILLENRDGNPIRGIGICRSSAPNTFFMSMFHLNADKKRGRESGY